jgi:Dynein heavy chain C-terminal domain
LQQVKEDVTNFFKPTEYVNLSVTREKGFNSLIYKEVMMYNMLMVKIHQNIEETRLVLDGLKATNERTSSTLDSLLLDRTPPEWLAHSYPASHSLSIFIQNLKKRISYIRSLLEESRNGKIERTSFWLPGFFDQHNFLTSLIQVHARKTKQPIETLHLQFTLATEKSEKSDNFQIEGLFIYGAVFDNNSMRLEEAPNQGCSPIPPIEVRVLSEPQESLADIYMCPVYVTFHKNRLLRLPRELEG